MPVTTSPVYFTDTLVLRQQSTHTNPLLHHSTCDAEQPSLFSASPHCATNMHFQLPTAEGAPQTKGPPHHTVPAPWCSGGMRHWPQVLPTESRNPTVTDLQPGAHCWDSCSIRSFTELGRTLSPTHFRQRKIICTSTNSSVPSCLPHRDSPPAPHTLQPSAQGTNMSLSCCHGRTLTAPAASFTTGNLQAHCAAIPFLTAQAQLTIGEHKWHTGIPALCCRACAAPQWDEKATHAIALSPGKSWAGRAHEASRARGQAAPLHAADPHPAITTHSLLFPPPGFSWLSLPYHTLFT